MEFVVHFKGRNPGAIGVPHSIRAEIDTRPGESVSDALYRYGYDSVTMITATPVGENVGVARRKGDGR